MTVIGVLASAFGGATLGDRLAAEIEQLPGLVGRYAHAISIGIVVAGISYVSLVIGELVPKRIALSRPEAIAAGFARFLRGFSRVAAPLEWLLGASSNLILRLVPLRPERQGVTEEEIAVMLREGTAAGHFHAVETGIVQMAFRLGDRRISAVMTPRTQVEWVDLEDSPEEAKALHAQADQWVVKALAARKVSASQPKPSITIDVNGDPPMAVPLPPPPGKAPRPANPNEGPPPPMAKK